MQKAIYITENAAKNLLRTQGLLPTAVLTFLLCLCSFLALDGSMLFSHWHTLALKEAEAEGTQFVSPWLFTILVFKIMAALLAIIFAAAGVGYVRRTFSQYMMMQKDTLQIMSFLGEDDRSIRLEFALQPVYLLLVTAVLAGFSGNFLFDKLMHTPYTMRLFGDIMTGFEFPYLLDGFLILGCCVYILLRGFFFAKRTLYTEDITSVEEEEMI